MLRKSSLLLFVLIVCTLCYSLVVCAEVTLTEKDIYSLDFDDIGNSYENTDFMDYCSKNSASFPWSSSATINDAYITVEPKDENPEDKRLHLKFPENNRTQSSKMELTLPEKVSGVAYISFKMQITDSTLSSYYNDFIAFTDSQNRQFATIKHLYKGLSVGASNNFIGGSDSHFGSDTARLVEIYLDFDNKKYWAYSDGVLTANTLNFSNTSGSDLKKIRFLTYATQDVYKIEFYMDDFVVRQLTNPTATVEGMSNGETGVDIAAPRIKFSSPVDISEARKIKLYADGELVEDAVYTMGDDSKSVTIGEDLKYSTPYKLVFKGIMDTNRLYFADGDFTFHTMHKPTYVIADVPSFTGPDGITPVTAASLESVNSFKTSVLVVNGDTENSADVTLIAAIYRNGIMMENVDCVKKTLMPGTDETFELQMDLPQENKSELSVKLYLWDDCMKMRALGTLGQLQ